MAVLSQMLMGSYGSRVAPTYLGTLADTVDRTTYNFGNVIVPRAGLLVALATGRSGSNRTLNSVSLGGSGAALHAGATTGSTQNPTGIASRQVSAGNNAVSAVFNSGMLRAIVHLYLIEGQSSDTPVDTDAFASNTDDDDVSNTYGVPNGGLALSLVSVGRSSGTLGPNVWSDATSDGDVDTEGNIMSASARYDVPGAGHIETVTMGTTGIGSYSMVTAVWG